MAAKDTFVSGPGQSAPARNLALVTGDDSNDLDSVTRGLFVNTAGNVKVTTAGGQTLVLPLTSGWHPICVSRIWSTSTTATGLVAAW